MLFFHSKRVYWRLLLFSGRLTRLVYARDDCSRCHCTSPDATAAAAYADAGVHCQSSPTVQQKERLVVYPSSKCNSSCCYRPNASLSLCTNAEPIDAKSLKLRLAFAALRLPLAYAARSSLKPARTRTLPLPLLPTLSLSPIGLLTAACHTKPCSIAAETSSLPRARV